MDLKALTGLEPTLAHLLERQTNVVLPLPCTMAMELGTQ
jgi:hypothetical protein